MSEPQPVPQSESGVPHRSGWGDPWRRRSALIAAACALLASLAIVLLHQAPSATSAAAARPTHSVPGVATVRLADFRNEKPTPEARRMADWALTSGDHQGKAFVIVDKKKARVYVFDPAGRLKDSAPALLGSAIGDDSAPGIGDKPLADVLPQEKTTPAGRFVAEIGMSTRGEDVVWVDYGAAVSMHRVLNVKERLVSLASPAIADKRMSYGCVNLPPDFYEKVLRPAAGTGSVIYILPETRPLEATFASFYDVGHALQLAQHSQH